MRERCIWTAGLLSLLLAVDAVAQAPPARPQPVPRANICSTEWGWCPLPPGTVTFAGTPCVCHDPRTGGPIPGVCREFNYTQYPRPVSPYLNPHWSP